jgi:hypothetical protein
LHRGTTQGSALAFRTAQTQVKHKVSMKDGVHVQVTIRLSIHGHVLTLEMLLHWAPRCTRLNTTRIGPTASLTLMGHRKERDSIRSRRLLVKNSRGRLIRCEGIIGNRAIAVWVQYFLLLGLGHDRHPCPSLPQSLYGSDFFCCRCRELCNF